jgi:hypothetical protein
MPAFFGRRSTVPGVAGDERRMTIVEHLEELRSVLIISAIAWIAATVAAFVFHDAIFQFLLRPLTTVLAKTNDITSTAIFTSPTDGLTIPIKISAIVGFVGALPVVLWQVWGFVSPGLPGGAQVRRAVHRLRLRALRCRRRIRLLRDADRAQLPGHVPRRRSHLPAGHQLLSLVPAAADRRLRTDVRAAGGDHPARHPRHVSSRSLRRRRKGIWVGIIAASLVVIPGADPFTPVMLLIPLIVFFEASVLILDKALKR